MTGAVLFHGDRPVAGEGPELRFGILGPLEVVRAGLRLSVPAAKQRIALAALLLEANHYVSADRLIEYMWPKAAPSDARAALHTHIARLRHALRDRAEGRPLIVTKERGYLIEVSTAEVDVLQFRDLVQRAANVDDAVAEAALLKDALALWRGPALADLSSESLLHDHGSRLGEDRLRAIERWLELGLSFGEHEQIVPDLIDATTANPLRERLWYLLILALYRCGRQTEAVRAYHSVAESLNDELGVDPSLELRRLHEAILVADPALAVAVVPGGSQGSPDVRPRQLPSDVTAFTGRTGQLNQLDLVLDRAADAGSARPVRIAAITGTAGVGKTALAVHWGHRVHERFPDGQLYVNLRGFGPGAPMEPARALELLLQGSGVPAQRLPSDLDARSALLRSVLAERRVLIVLDNARDVAQVRPLLPGAGCVVLVTSRDQLRGLSVQGDTVHVTLGVFSPEESTALLTSLLGARASSTATAELGALCAHLPLALRIAVANLLHDQHQGVAEYVADLRRGDRLNALLIDGDEHYTMRGALDLSYAALSPRTRSVFRLLGLVPGADFTIESTAALTGDTVGVVRQEINRLAAANLIDQYQPGRFRFHDLLRLYAAERAHEEDSPERLEAARRRFGAWRLRATRAAVERICPTGARGRLPASLLALTDARASLR